MSTLGGNRFTGPREVVREGPLVTVVIIFFENEAFLAEAIDSVLAQTYTNWELLLCDDGSTDGSTAIARDYAGADPQRIHYLAHPGHENLGKNATRNLGIRRASGDFVAFLDGDDVWLPTKLDRQVRLLAENPDAAMLYGRTQYWLSWTGEPADADRDSLIEEGFHRDRLVPPPLPLVHYLEDEGVYPCMCSVIVRRSVFDEIGLFDEEYRDGSQDMVFHTKVFLNAPVYVSSECWDRYRIHPDSFWGRMREQGLYEDGKPHAIRRRYLEWLRSHLIERGIDSPAVWRALDQALRPYRHPHLAAFEQRLGRLRERIRTAAARISPGLKAP